MAESEKNGQPNASQRAETTLEDVGRKAGRFLAVAFARVREEAEDMWAEAQSLRRGERE